MIIFLLSVIVAILLFGSSMVLGVIGFALGILASIVAFGIAVDLWNTLGPSGRLTVALAPFAVIVGTAVAAAIIMGGAYLMRGLRAGFRDSRILSEWEHARTPFEPRSQVFLEPAQPAAPTAFHSGSAAIAIERMI